MASEGGSTQDHTFSGFFFSATFPYIKQRKTDQLDAAFFFEFQLPTTSHRFLTQFFRIHLSFTNSFKAILMALEMT